MPILIPVFFIIASMLLITKGSDWLTESLVPIAKKLKTSNVFVGVILVSVVVSLPEILIAVMSGLQGYQDISLGVVFGSIMCDIALMTGLNAIIRPLTVTKTLILRDGALSVIIPILIFSISQGGQITRLHGLSMFLLFIPYLINVYLQEKAAGTRELTKEKIEVKEELELIEFGSWKIPASWLAFLSGMIALLIGTAIFSHQLITVTQMFEINQLLVGMTLGAIIPSLPNIIAAFQATRKGLTEVSVSETLGSNIFTLLVTIGILSMISPFEVNPQWLYFDIPAMMCMSFLLFICMISDKTISRLEGMILVASYLCIIAAQFYLIPV